MKKLAGIVFSVIMMSVLLTGCYTKTCDQPQTYRMYKGEG